MSVIYNRTKKNPYSLVSNAILNDPKLSLKAKGLLALIVSKPPDWHIRVSHLIELSLDGRDSILTAFRELKAAGYCRADKNKTGAIDYYFTDDPFDWDKSLERIIPLREKPGVDNPTEGNSHSGKIQPLYKKDLEQKKDLIIRKNTKGFFGDFFINDEGKKQITAEAQLTALGVTPSGIDRLYEGGFNHSLIAAQIFRIKNDSKITNQPGALMSAFFPAPEK